MNSYLQLIFNGIRSGKKISGKCTVVALTSAEPQAGVSYVTQSFAVEMARRTGKRTLIADADELQQAELLHYGDVADYCSPTNVPNLYVFSPADEHRRTRRKIPKHYSAEDAKANWNAAWKICKLYGLFLITYCSTARH